MSFVSGILPDYTCLKMLLNDNYMDYIQVVALLSVEPCAGNPTWTYLRGRRRCRRGELPKSTYIRVKVSRNPPPRGLWCGSGSESAQSKVACLLGRSDSEVCSAASGIVARPTWQWERVCECVFVWEDNKFYCLIYVCVGAKAIDMSDCDTVISS